MIRYLFTIIILAMAVLLQSCSYRLVDFTAISSKNVALDLALAKKMGKRTEGSKKYFLGVTYNIKDALDDALEKAGPNYDLLVDGVIYYKDAFFVVTVICEGIAIDTSLMKKKLGQVGFEKWLNGHKISYDKRNDIVYQTQK